MARGGRRTDRRARRGEHTISSAEDDLGVRADVDEELDAVSAMGSLGQDRGRGVGADVSGDARQEVDLGEPCVDVELTSGRRDGEIGRYRRDAGRRHPPIVAFVVFADFVARRVGVDDDVLAFGRGRERDGQ